MTPRLLILAFISLTAIAQPAISGGISNSEPVLLLFSINDPYIDLSPVYSSDKITLAFGDPIAHPGAQAILQGKSGDYYLLRLKSAEELVSAGDSIPNFQFDQIAIIKVTPDKVESLSRFGQGLTLLSPSTRVISSGPGIIFPEVTIADINISNLISVITPLTSRQYIADLSGISTRYSYAPGSRQAEQYIFNKLDSLSFQTTFFNYQYYGTAMRDVIAQRFGTVHPESIIIVCGHLDCTSETPSQLAPGAEDNGTGVSVVLEAAHALRQTNSELTIRFVAFSGEEQGLIGSSRYADSCQRAGENIAAVINADMVGYSGSYVSDMHIFSDPRSYSLGALGAQIISTYTTLDTVPHYGASVEYGSDHYPFSIRGYPAIFFIDAWDGVDWYPFYHTMADTLGNLNFYQQAAIAQAVTAMVATLARFNPNTGPDYLSGDANDSGDVNGLDVVYMVNFLRGLGPAPNPLLRGDSNGDCSANGVDIIYLINYLKGLGLAPVLGNCR